VVIRFGRDHDSDCMRQDEVLYKIADKVKNFAVSLFKPFLDLRSLPHTGINITTTRQKRHRICWGILCTDSYD